MSTFVLPGPPSWEIPGKLEKLGKPMGFVIYIENGSICLYSVACSLDPSTDRCLDWGEPVCRQSFDLSQPFVVTYAPHLSGLCSIFPELKHAVLPLFAVIGMKLRHGWSSLLELTEVRTSGGKRG